MAKQSYITKKHVSSTSLMLLLIIFFISLCLFCSSMNAVTNFPPKKLKRIKEKMIANHSMTESGGCPEYFRWIHEDLRPWKSSGIEREVLEGTKEYADFKLVIVKGKVYVEKYRKAYQTRDLFTIWGILQLIRLYPGRVPDLELMFNCADRPNITQPYNATLPPLLFQYSKSEGEVGVLFPDWTFWGWAEVNVKPWKVMLKKISKGKEKTKWKDREAHAYWRGNPYVNYVRPKLLECNVSHNYDWNARIYNQEWDKEAKEGYKHSKLEDQCTYRYKIYIEGWGWSVSEKYIMACDSMVLFVEPKFFSFFTRSMVPMHHYWHIRRKSENMCRDIKFAVDWGNNHTRKAQDIGIAGSKFIEENLKMENVYDYMLHVLNEYAKLLKFKPRRPLGAEEILPQTMTFSKDGLWRKFMVESMVSSSTPQLPCTLPPPYTSNALHAILKTKHTNHRKVETWSDQYWTD